jgi:hypothetical protein
MKLREHLKKLEESELNFFTFQEENAV